MTALVTRSDWVRDVRATLKNSEDNFHTVRPAIYWRDMMVGAAIAYTSAAIFLKAPAFSVFQVVAFPIAVFWLYRVGSLVHEVCHLGRHECTSFKVAWNLIVGVPTLTPSTFFTGHHRDHHTQRVYGTPQDPEYVVNVCRRGALNLVVYFAYVAIFPLLVFLRFILSPLTFVTPQIRDYTLRHFSAFTFNWKYERPLSRIDRKSFAALELLCCFRAWCIPAAIFLMGWFPWTHMVQLYMLGAATIILNQLRQLADHHFEGNGGNLSMSDHIMDSCNYVGKDPLTWLFFPFAIQYHALHHMFPSLPYHNLAAAHDYLMVELPEDSPYRDLQQPGWWSVARKMLVPEAKAELSKTD